MKKIFLVVVVAIVGIIAFLKKDDIAEKMNL